MSKNKSIKSNISMTSPKGSLIAQINVLRKELKDYKSSKKDGNFLNQKPIKELFLNMNKKQPINRTTSEQFFIPSKQTTFPNSNKLKYQTLKINEQQRLIELSQSQKLKLKYQQATPIIEDDKETGLKQIWLKEKDRKLKLDIELNKLRKLILKVQPRSTMQQLNYIISLVNSSTREYIDRIETLEKNQKNDLTDQSLQIQRQQQQLSIFSQQIQTHVAEIRQLKTQLKVLKDQECSLKEKSLVITAENKELVGKVQSLECLTESINSKFTQLEQENKILGFKLLKKEEQLILQDEDLNYLRLQSQNCKQQKKQLNELYENALASLRQLKRLKSLEIEELQSEKQRWQRQCRLRRNQSEEISSLQAQKLTLLKQLSEMRYICNLKTTELESRKTQMYQNQKKIIQLQSELYKLKNEIQSLKNQKEFCEFENQKTKDKLEDLKRYASRNDSRQLIVIEERPILANTDEPTLPKDPSDELQQKQQVGEQINADQNQSKRKQYSKKLKQKQQKLLALEGIHSLIKKHRLELHI